jgi:hypothetical protein
MGFKPLGGFEQVCQQQKSGQDINSDHFFVVLWLIKKNFTTHCKR